LDEFAPPLANADGWAGRLGQIRPTLGAPRRYEGQEGRVLVRMAG